MFTLNMWRRAALRRRTLTRSDHIWTLYTYYLTRVSARRRGLCERGLKLNH